VVKTWGNGEEKADKEFTREHKGESYNRWGKKEEGRKGGTGSYSKKKIKNSGDAKTGFKK